VGKPSRMHLPNVTNRARQKHQLSVLMTWIVSHILRVLAPNLTRFFADAALMMRQAVVLFLAPLDPPEIAPWKRVVLHTRHATPSIHYQRRNLSEMILFPTIQRSHLNPIIAD